MIQPVRNLPPRPELQLKPPSQPQPAPQPQASSPIEEKSLLGKLLPAIGTIAVAGGLAALGWFAYMEKKQPVSLETLPVIKAEETPYKEKPEDPGGMEFPNRDKQIYEALSGETPHDPMKIEDILPPPEEPVTREDLMEQAGVEPQVPTDMTHEAPITPLAQPLAEAEMVPAMPPLPQAETSPHTQDMQAAISQEEDALAAISEQGPQAPSAASSAPPLPAGIPEDAVTALPAPKTEAQTDVEEIPVAPPLPETGNLTPAQAPQKVEVPLEPAPPAVQEKKPEMEEIKQPEIAAAPKKTKAPAISVLPASMADRGFRLQLGSYKDMENLEKGWNSLQKRYPQQLSKLHHSVDKVSLGGKGTFYRLQAGAIGKEADARRLCKELIAKKQGCIVVQPKG